MAITFAQAEAALAAGGFNTVESIVSFLKTVSGNVSGATSSSTYLLYSGLMPDGTTWAREIASTIKATGGGLDVTMSEAGQLLQTLKSQTSLLTVALRRAIKLELFHDPFANLTTPEQITAFKNRVSGIKGARLELVSSTQGVSFAFFLEQPCYVAHALS